MALPKIDLPIYDLTVPSSKKIITVRPFSVKEEKLLLMAVESKDNDEVIRTVKQVVNNCIVSEDVDIDKLPFFDVDYMFIFLRAKSVGESVDVNLTCNNILENGNKCGHVFQTAMDISKCELITEDVSDDIKLDDKGNGVKLKYPNYATIKRVEENEIDAKTNMIVNSIDYIYDKKSKYSAKDHSKEELKDYIEGLTEENYKKLEAYVDNYPTFAVNLEATCPSCGFRHKVRYTDFYDFFF